MINSLPQFLILILSFITTFSVAFAQNQDKKPISLKTDQQVLDQVQLNLLKLGKLKLDKLKLDQIPKDLGINQGGWSGGGGFRFKNSRAFLKVVSTELADQILDMDPVVFKNFPKDLGQTEMARIIRSIKGAENETSPRARPNPDGEIEELMFDYGRDQNGYYLVALRPYFEAYQFIPVEQIQRELKNSNRYQIPEFYTANAAELKHRLVHEFAHLLNLNEDAAEDFANRFILKVERSFLFCQATQIDPPSINRHGAKIQKNQNDKKIALLIEQGNPRVLFIDLQRYEEPQNGPQDYVMDIVENGFETEKENEWVELPIPFKKQKTSTATTVIYRDQRRVSERYNLSAHIRNSWIILNLKTFKGQFYFGGDLRAKDKNRTASDRIVDFSRGEITSCKSLQTSLEF